MVKGWSDYALTGVDGKADDYGWRARLAVPRLSVLKQRFALSDRVRWEAKDHVFENHPDKIARIDFDVPGGKPLGRGIFVAA
jgi:hypothetical protein